jgi:ferredoxin/coenzyme F420-reducing hydrogenase delta subunit
MPTPSASDPDAASTLEAMAGGPGASVVDVLPPMEVDPPTRGESLWRALERGFLGLDRGLARLVPTSLNPLLHTGAIAVTSFLVAAVTGIVLLLWYKPSVHLAYTSVAAMGDAPWTAGLLRSLHRYSSDLCMFFGLVHAVRLFLERRFTGARWLAWVTGIAMVGILWLTGWTGYWLVWDQRAQHVAVGSARMLDAIPIFADPMGRSFLTDEAVNSLLFFVVFFLHMLIPLLMGIALWLHIARVARARFLTDRLLSAWVLGVLVLLSAAYPATIAAPARMTALPQAFAMDWWYLLPVALTDRESAGALWLLVLAGGAVAFAVPWILGRRLPRPASVIASRCNACMKCFNDCPHVAISMIPRTDGSTKFEVQADVDPAKCVGCGICAGSCDTAGVGLEWFAVPDQRKRLARWLRRALARGEPPHVALVCAESAGASLRVDPETGTCPTLPGYLVLKVPCAGWLHPFAVEHTLRFGGAGTLVVSCGPDACRYREGAEWTRQRLAGEREPALRTEKVPADRWRLLELDRTREAALRSEARAFREDAASPAGRRRSPALTGVAAAVLAAVFGGGIGLVSDLGYATPTVEGSELVVTFKHPGQISENCRDLTEEELAARPVHMRQARICDRDRAPVRLRVSVDGATVMESSFPPTGIWGDGNSVAVERVPVAPGEHRVRVAIGDSRDPEEWTFVDEKTLTFTDRARRVVSFDRVIGFHWN